MQKETSKKCWEVGSLYEIAGRHYFTDDTSVAWVPDLLEVQLDSYKTFLEKWIDEAFREIFPISDFSGERIDIYYKGYFLEEPKFDAETCKKKNLNFGFLSLSSGPCFIGRHFTVAIVFE